MKPKPASSYLRKQKDLLTLLLLLAVIAIFHILTSL
jgi:hypothetical protein